MKKISAPKAARSAWFNSFIVDQLEAGAIDALVRHGAERANIHVVKALGAYELPLVVQRVAASKKYDAIIAVGAVIRSGAVRRISNTSPGNASKVSAVFR